MKLLSSVFMVMFFMVFVFNAYPQQSGHAAHHPEQVQEAIIDTSQGTDMMQGTMMSGMMDKCRQMMQGDSKAKMMHGKGMMGNMMKGHAMMGMSGPMHRYLRTVNHLPDMAAQLNLSDQQMAQLKKMRADFLKKKADWDAAVTKTRLDLNGLLDQQASASEVRKVLNDVSRTHLDMQVSAYETAQKMLSVLSAEQKEKFTSQKAMKCGHGMMDHMM